MNEFEIALTAGACLAAIYLAGFLVSSLIQRACAFINDSKKAENNFLMKKVCLIFGLKPSENTRHNYEGGWMECSSGEVPFFLALIALVFSPIVALIAFKLYPVTLSIFLLLSLIYIARMVVRGRKLFNKHIKDKYAHS